jgi:redox-sensing transcriptional repressor
LGTTEAWNVIVVGAGQLCRALLRYPGFVERGFHLLAAFDTDPHKIGTKIGSVQIRHINELEQVIAQNRVRLAILTVPAQAAQGVARRLVQAGIEGIMNFATTRLETPPHVNVNQVDLTAHLEQLSFQVSNSRA